MKNPARILLASDFSSTCERARKHAAALAARSGAQLHVLNVQVLRSDLFGWQDGPNMAELGEVMHKAATERMQEFVKGLSGDVVHDVINDTQVAPAIMRYAHKMDIDLIVMGTHARKGVSRLFLGSVAAEVLRVADLPVLVIGPDHPVADNGYHKIVVAVDLSENSATLLQQATTLANADNAQIRVVHVSESRSLAPYYGTETAVEQREKAEHALKSLLDDTALAGKVEAQILVGQSEDKIIASAEDFAADLIVMGSAGMSRIGRMLLGSTTDRVLRQAPCAVLAWRDGQKREAQLPDAG